ncbi:serine hydrolase domain-containing protein [Aquimarina pacifica]|uniref:serine hydrolase domain-containing protein n=1 Tax=Aquimarina pacifica TaxID=1296415 RepID=UPI001F4C5AD6|nr:serine hydrolase domain-containing protein [Aquimarina pacifica]
MKKITVLLFCLLLCDAFAQTNDSISNMLTKELEHIYSRGHINGFSVAIVNESGGLYTKGFGYANVNEKKKYTKNTIQNIGSISKTLIGVALLKAQELGKLHLDDPINTFLPFEISNPNFPDSDITIRHLTTHTSSITDSPKYYKNGYVLKAKENPGVKVNTNFRSPDEIISLSVFFERILSKPGDWYCKKDFLKKKPGTFFKYSNVAAGLAAYILEQATGQSFSTFTKTHIFDPLEMSNTGWSFSEIDFSKHSRLYSEPTNELAFYKLVNYPDGGLLTSSDDLQKYLFELIKGYEGNGGILKKESFEELFTPRLEEINFDKRSTGSFSDDYNMGVFMGFSAKGYVGHTGSDPGIGSFMFFDPKTKIGKLLIVNTELKKEGVAEFKDIWKKLQEYEHKLKL